jgi:small ligand-binding sensory domain FIST
MPRPEREHPESKPSSPTGDGRDQGAIVLANALSINEDPIDAAAQAASRLHAKIEDKPDLLMVFVTPHHAQRMGMIADTLRDALGANHMVGVSASAIMSGSTEVNDSPGIALLSCNLPGVRISPFWVDHISPRDSTDERAAKLADQIDAGTDMRAAFFFADPFSVPLVKLIPALSASRMQHITSTGRVESIGTILGGMASAATRPGGNSLLLDGDVRSSGAMGVTLSGPIQIDTVVSQGCRPIGNPMIITKARGNLILELAGIRAVDAIRDVVHMLSEQDKQLLGNGLLLGRVIDEHKSHFGRGDFLIRNVMGGDENSGAVAVADLVQAGQTVQLHLHDEQTAREDLSLLLDGQRLYDKPAGALLVSCTGRGEKFFEEPGHDARAIAHAFDQSPDGAKLAKSGEELRAQDGIPLAGFFAAGEIAPIDQQIFQHGHTAVAGLFRRPDPLMS